MPDNLKHLYFEVELTQQPNNINYHINGPLTDINVLKTSH